MALMPEIIDSNIIYLNKTCWNGLYRVNKDGYFNVPVGQVDQGVEVFNSDQLIIASHLLQRAKIKCCDFEKAVKRSACW